MRLDEQPVAVVIVAWNSASTIEKCLHAALRERPAEVVVVDNASTDDTVARVAAFADVDLICEEENTGFAAGCNRGVAATQSPYVLFLNDDAFLRPGYLAVLVDALQRDRCAASAVGKLVLSDGRIDSAGIELRRYALSPLDRGHSEPDRGQYDSDAEVFGPSAAAALYRREAVEEAGGFDEQLFMYYEDVDLAWRLGNRGWRHLFRPAAVGVHDRRGPGDKPISVALRAFLNRYVVFAKNESLLRFSTYAPAAVTREAARVARRVWMLPRLIGDRRAGIQHLDDASPGNTEEDRTPTATRLAAEAGPTGLEQTLALDAEVREIRAVRSVVSHLFLTGEGLEVGGGDRPFPLPDSTRCYRGDIRDDEKLCGYFKSDTITNDGYVDAQTFAGIHTDRLDFVISSHVIEHLQNPIGSIVNAIRVLRPGGVFLLVVPEMRHTFDCDRPETSLEHALRDFVDGGEGTRMQAYREHVIFVHPRFQSPIPAERVDAEAEKICAAGMDLHYHAWTRPGFERLLAAASSFAPFEMAFSFSVANENLFVLRKTISSDSESKE
jgi:GT2 family glycosyltransferase